MSGEDYIVHGLHKDPCVLLVVYCARCGKGSHALYSTDGRHIPGSSRYACSCPTLLALPAIHPRAPFE